MQNHGLSLFGFSTIMIGINDESFNKFSIDINVLQANGYKKLHGAQNLIQIILE